jgi:hypothetical protein
VFWYSIQGITNIVKYQVSKLICGLLDYLTVGSRFSGDCQRSAEKYRLNFHFNPENGASKVLRDNGTAQNTKLVISTSVKLQKVSCRLELVTSRSNCSDSPSLCIPLPAVVRIEISLAVQKTLAQIDLSYGL